MRIGKPDPLLAGYSRLNKMIHMCGLFDLFLSNEGNCSYFACLCEPINGRKIKDLLISLKLYNFKMFDSDLAKLRNYN